MTRKTLLLYSALLITLWLTWRSHQQGQPIELAAPTRELPANTMLGRLNTHGTTTLSNDQLTLKPRKIVPSQVNLFASVQVVMPAPAKKTLFIAPPPVAPAQPFKYLGLMQVGTGTGVMLEVQGEVIPIQQGDILQGQYKVQSITETAAGLQIQFLYLPLNQVQTLNAQTIH